MQDSKQKLERFIDQALRQQVPLRAPAGLQARVLFELARRAALPWWRMSFAHWPLAARAGFIVACGALIKLAFSSTTWVLGAAEAPAASVRNGAHVASSLGDVVRILFDSIPSHWLYLAAALGVAMYLTLFGVGAAAYRTLYK
jgi:hypothetical protein